MGDVRQRVAVIGAGPSGLCSLKHLVNALDKFDPVAFERNSVPGGLWNYSDQSENDDFGKPIHSAIYWDMLTNIPKEVMQIPGFPFPQEWTKSYIHRSKVLEYLNNFIDHYGIRKYIQTHTFVKNVSPVENNQKGSSVKWKVETADVRKPDVVTTQIFDAVLVCNGHDSNPYIPEIPGKEQFEGRMLHSKNYRKAVHFEGQRVAILGCHFSGQDIAMQISKYAKKVYACHRLDPKDFPVTFPREIEQRPPFVRMTKSSVGFPDGSDVEVDVVIFCTGYRYSFPFLQNGLITIQEERVTPLYKHIIHAKYPNLFLLGIPRQLSYFPHFHEMTKLVVLILEGKVKLPKMENMLQDSDRDFNRRKAEGMPTIYAHYFGLGDEQSRYNAELAQLGGFRTLPRYYQNVWDDVLDERRMNIVDCHNFDYVITGEDSYRCLQPQLVKSTRSKAENV